MKGVDIFDQTTISDLLSEARKSPRLRSHKNLHTSYSDKVQRVIIGLIKGTVIPPHYHFLEHQWEYFQIIQGVVELSIYSSTGEIIESIILGDKNSQFAIQIPPNTIHSLACISDEAIIIEVKEGPFDEQFAKKLVEF